MVDDTMRVPRECGIAAGKMANVGERQIFYMRMQVVGKVSRAKCGFVKTAMSVRDSGRQLRVSGEGFGGKCGWVAKFREPNAGM